MARVVARLLPAARRSLRLLTTASHRPSRPPAANKLPPPPPPAASASADAGQSNVEWLMSEERTAHLQYNEKWLMRIALVSSGLAIASFTYTKWEVEAKLKNELNDDERKAWYSGSCNATLSNP